MFNLIFLNNKTNESEYEVQLRNIHIVIERRQNEEKLIEYNRRKDKEISEIPLSRNLIRAYNFTKGETDLSNYNLITSGQLPEQVYIAFVPQDAYNGSSSTNPFEFKTLLLEQACLNANSSLEPSQPYNTTATGGKRLSAYHSFLENTGNSQRESLCNTISYEKYYNGYFMLAFDRTPAKNNRARRVQMDSGTLGTLLKLQTGLSETTSFGLFIIVSE